MLFQVIKIMNKLCPVLELFGVSIFFALLLINSNNIHITYATPNQNNQLTRSFNAEGTINTDLDSLDLANRQNYSEVSNSTSNLNISESYVLGGKWRLDVINDNVTYYKANITMVSTNGRGEHFHVIVYKPVSHGISMLASSTQRHGILSTIPGNNTITFSGPVDIITNGVTQWRDVPMITSIYNDKVLRIYLDKIAINDHFLDKDIFGLINSVEPILNASKPTS
jgi:hypothetical protein